MKRRKSDYKSTTCKGRGRNEWPLFEGSSKGLKNRERGVLEKGGGEMRRRNENASPREAHCAVCGRSNWSLNVRESLENNVTSLSTGN